MCSKGGRILWSTLLQNKECLEYTRKYMLNPFFQQIVTNQCCINNNSKVLEVGCGLGHLSKFISKCVDNVKFFGVDSDLEFIKAGKKMEGNNTINYIVGDAYDLPFEKNYFDTIISLTLFNCIDFPDLVLQEMKRVVKNEGVITSITALSNSVSFSNEGSYPLECKWVKKYNDLEREFVFATEKIGTGFSYMNRGINTTQIPRLFYDNGLEKITIFVLPYCFSLSDASINIKEKNSYLKNLYISKVNLVNNLKENDEFIKIFSKLKCQEYINYLGEKVKFWNEHISDNSIWEFISGNLLIVSGKIV